MGKYADVYQADLDHIFEDLEEFEVSVVYGGVTFYGRKDSLSVDPQEYLTGQWQGYVYSVWINLGSHDGDTPPESHETCTVDGTEYEVIMTYAPDNITLRLDLRTVN